MAGQLGFVALLERPLRFVDVGCRWAALDHLGALGAHVEVLGFDPDPEECARLEGAWPGTGSARFLPYALGQDDTQATLHVTASPACSSLYEPIDGLWRDYPSLEVQQPVGTAPVSLTRLADVLQREGFTPVDVIKLDVQGAELDVLRGGADALAAARVVRVEASFEPMYKGQALFPEVHTFMREAGFRLWRFDDLIHYRRNEIAPFASELIVFSESEAVVSTYAGGQLFWGDACYVHDRTFAPATWHESLLDAAAFVSLGISDRAAASYARAVALAPPAIRARLEDMNALPPAGSALRHMVGRTLRAAGLRR